MLASGAHKLDATERTNDVQITENINFEGLLLSEQTLAGLSECGFEKPSPIQFKAIPFGKCGFDLIAQAKSGTGKTCMFGVIALEMLQLPSKSLQVLILAPTREIAAQVADVITTIGQGHEGLKVATFIGGMPIEEDRRNARVCHVAVGSPGRMKQLIDEKVLNIEHVRLVVLDEADKLMEPGFLEDINHIFSLLPENKQTLAASATYTEELKTFLEMYMRSPLRVSPESLQREGDADDTVLLGVRQSVGFVNFHPNLLTKFRRKLDALVYLLSSIPFKQCLVFNNMHGQAESMSQLLNTKGFPTEFISGHMEQPRRLRAIASLVDFKCRVLLSTDLSARGLDAANVDLVINMDIPLNEATYLHRVGRAGRFGSKGLVVTISENSGKDLNKLYNISTKIHVKLHCFNLDINKEFTLDLWNPSSLLPLEEFNIIKPVMKSSTVKPLQKSEDKINSEQQIKKEDSNKNTLKLEKMVEDLKLNESINGTVSDVQSQKEENGSTENIETMKNLIDFSSILNKDHIVKISTDYDVNSTCAKNETEELNISSESSHSGKSKPTKPPRKPKTSEDWNSKFTAEILPQVIIPSETPLLASKSDDNLNQEKEISTQINIALSKSGYDHLSSETSQIKSKSIQHKNHIGNVAGPSRDFFNTTPNFGTFNGHSPQKSSYEMNTSKSYYPSPKFGNRYVYSNKYQDNDSPYVSNHPRDTYSPGYLAKAEFTPSRPGYLLKNRTNYSRFNENSRGRGYFQTGGGRRYYHRQNYKDDFNQALSKLFQQIKAYSLPDINNEIVDYATLIKLADLYVHTPMQKAIYECKYPNFDYTFLLTALRKLNGEQVIKTKQKFVKHGGTVKYLQLLARGYESEEEEEEEEVKPTPVRNEGYCGVKNVLTDYNRMQSGYFTRILRTEWALGYKVDEEGNRIQTKVEKKEKIPCDTTSSDEDKVEKVRRRKKSFSKSVSSLTKLKKSNLMSSSDRDDESQSIPSSEPETEELYCKKPYKTSSNETVCASSQQMNEETEKLSEMEEENKPVGQDNGATASPTNNSEATGYNPYEYPPLPSDPSEFDVWKQQVKLTSFMIHYAKYMELMYSPDSK